ncbi:hypothetical protein [uncultured Hymenobacter sp.]|uniref:hypothetical protein n=1 Tax=uncultured Hymenobacter sp. TaxID=170016 RepID=UPI0035CC0A1F
MEALTDSFPFRVVALPAALRTAERQVGILADVAGLEDHYALFEKYGFGGTGASWVEHIETIIEELEPELLDHLEFAEQGGAFFTFADGELAVSRFLRLVLPIFGTLPSLQKYLSQADPEDFFE